LSGLFGCQQALEFVQIQIGKLAHGAAETDARPIEPERSTDETTDEGFIVPELVGLANGGIIPTIGAFTDNIDLDFRENVV
jgi:hypothetical protein